MSQQEAKHTAGRLSQNEIALLAALMHAHGALVSILDMELAGVSSTAIYAAASGAAACAKVAIEQAGRKA